jgi:N,N'-diacetyllegionaminate synthase
VTAGFDVEGRRIGAGAPVFVIAEIGVNHGGDESAAAALIGAAAEAGADAVKFQTVDVAESYLPGTDSYAAFQGCDLPLAAMKRLNALARQRGLVPFSTPGGFRALERMRASDMRLIKISSGQMTNLPLVRAAAATGLPLIVSTGMAHLDEVAACVDAARAAGAEHIALLHCTSLYPAPEDALNLRAIRTLAETFTLPVGYSDHHLGALACIAAVAAGACAIEKHVTLDRTAPGADHAISAEPAELAELVRSIRTVERMLGSPVKRPTEAEVALRPARHRYIVACRDVAAGSRLCGEDLGLLRVPPGSGRLEAAAYDRVLGARARRDIPAGTAIDEDMVEPAR